jgi:predicted MFS family arabinose efflux permease
MGMHQSIYAIGMFTGPWLRGIIADTAGVPTMFIITAGFVLLGGVSLTYLLTNHQKTITAPSKE